MKLSEIDVPFVKEYLRQDGDEDDKLIGAILEGAKDYIVKYTGQSLRIGTKKANNFTNIKTWILWKFHKTSRCKE